MAVKYLDETGLAYLWAKIKAYVDSHAGNGLGDWTAITLPYYVTEDSVVQVYLMPSNASSAYFMMNKEASSLTFRLNSHSGFSEYGETTVKAGTQLTQSALSNGTVSIRIRPLHS